MERMLVTSIERVVMHVVMVLNATTLVVEALIFKVSL